MATPVSSEQIRYRYAEPPPPHAAGSFAVWRWTAWIWGILPWVVFVVFAEPIVSAMYRGEFEPASPAVWVAVGLYDALILVVLPAWALYASWAHLFILRVADEQIRVGRWFGARSTVYRASDIVTWRAGDWRWRAVPEGKNPWKLRIDFSDGSWVRMSRTAWSFRKIEAWLRRSASGKDAATFASNVTPSTPHFVVHDTRMKLMAITFWVFLWMVTALSLDGFVSGRVQPGPGLGEAAMYALAYVMMLLPFLAGPLGAHLAFKDLRVEGSRIDVIRWFGLSRRAYHENDIKTWHARLDPNPPWWRDTCEATLAIHFVDGMRVLFMGRAANFDGLHQYLRARASSREDVGRSRRAAESQKKDAA